VDLVLVIGAQNSSNCNRLREVAERQGVPAYLINRTEDLDEGWIREDMKVGITSGASTPEVLVDGVISKLKPDNISTLKVTEEDVTFVLPKEFR
jgi:4-hydroxy-3-methylbut-2-enyl diphosphate reductase